MAQGSPSTMTFPPPYSPTDSTAAQQPWTFLFTTIHPLSSSRLQSVGITYIILGLVAIGLEAGILSRSDRLDISFSFFEYQLFGIYLFALGVTLVIVCRQQVCVLIGVFILLFFGLMQVIRKAVAYSLTVKSWSTQCIGSSSTYCETTQKGLVWVSFICAITGTGLTIFSMRLIKQACTPPRSVPQFQSIPMPYTH